MVIVNQIFFSMKIRKRVKQKKKKSEKNIDSSSVLGIAIYETLGWAAAQV